MTIIKTMIAAIFAVPLLAPQPARAEWYLVLESDPVCRPAPMPPDLFEQRARRDGFDPKRQDVTSGDMVVFTTKGPRPSAEPTRWVFFDGKFMCEWMMERMKN
jgi:hypothetical protein